MSRILLLIVLCLAGANSALAQSLAFDQLSVSPTPATANTPLRARSLFQFCRFLESIGKSTVTRSGNVLTLSIKMLPQPGVVCFATPPPAEAVFFELGQLEAGNYTLIQQPVSTDPSVSYPALTTQFSVAGLDSFSALSVLPNPAFAGQPLQARSTFNICLRHEGVTSSQVSLNGSIVMLTVHMQSGVNPCGIGVPPPPMPISFDLGSFPAGTYTLVQQPVSLNPNITYPPLTTSFTVGPERIAVPTLSNLGLFLLALVMGIAAAMGLSKRE